VGRTISVHRKDWGERFAIDQLAGTAARCRSKSMRHAKLIQLEFKLEKQFLLGMPLSSWPCDRRGSRYFKEKMRAAGGRKSEPFFVVFRNCFAWGGGFMDGRCGIEEQNAQLDRS
jgi:hypothetical protein